MSLVNRPFLIADLIDYAKSDVMPKSVRKCGLGGTRSVFFANNYKVIFRVAYRLTGSESDAEDVLQTIFLRLTSERGARDLSPNPPGICIVRR